MVNTILNICCSEFRCVFGQTYSSQFRCEPARITDLQSQKAVYHLTCNVSKYCILALPARFTTARGIWPGTRPTNPPTSRIGPGAEGRERVHRKRGKWEAPGAYNGRVRDGPNKFKTFTQCSYNADPESATLGQHWVKIVCLLSECRGRSQKDGPPLVWCLMLGIGPTLLRHAPAGPSPISWPNAFMRRYFFLVTLAWYWAKFANVRKSLKRWLSFWKVVLFYTVRC